MKIRNIFPTLFLLILISLSSYAQEEEQSVERAQILSVNINQETNTVDATVLAPKINNAVFNSTTAKFSELIDGKRYPMKFFRFEEIGGQNQEVYSILFVLDWSGSMREEQRLVKAKKAIFNTIQSISLPPGSKFYLTAFHDDIFENVEVNKSNIEAELEKYYVPLPRQGKGTDLYRATIVKTQEMQNFEGNKIILLLSDGENDLMMNQHYKNTGTTPPTPADVFNVVSEEDAKSNLAFYPIGLGSRADTTFLKRLPELTQNSKDRYIYSESPDDLLNIFLTVIAQYSVTYRVKLIPSREKEVFKGESRELQLDWQAKGLPTAMLAFYDYAGGSFIEPINLGISQSTYTTTFWLIYMLIGAGIVGALLALLMYMVPWLKKREFKTKYVIPYVPEKNKIRRDPITQDAFEEGDDVVVKCKQMTSLETWNALGHCPNYPNCMEFADPCNGSGGEDIQSNFFSQQGVFRVLNWLWFGATGGFAAWVLYAIVQIVNVNWLYNWTSSYFNSEEMTARLLELRGGESFLKNIPEMVDQTLIGLFIGVCLIIAIAVVEERGHSRKFSFWRIFIRGTVGVFVSFLVFFSGYIFQYLVLPQPFLAGIIIWAIFGVAFGAILSLNSTVEAKKGIIGGVISSLASYLIYYGISYITPDDVLAKLLSFIALGGVLGALIVTVLSNLEDFELIYLSPQEYTGMKKPISKWLKKGMEIYIGRSSKCYVFVKWEDEYVDDRHAKLIYQGGSVHIIPLFETMVNGVIVPENQKTALQGDDIIQLGRYSISRMQYKEKRS
ncbi:FHA domain-containing protein [Portibacter lacus]|uniref:VWA domain-containing protein n=1 Tax=Portibacter lacus TaxID=1099794 RepID=A0AA37WCM9_9BACT|nr:FHA domain-containing protein [Portibacter lacus]GLR16676.1 hypothetical protein GCM10007940_12910 [Portibacter lacus]